MGRALPSPSQSTPPEVDPESLEDGDRVVIRAERHGSGRPIEIIGTARPDHDRPEIVVEESDPDWTWLLDEGGQLYAHEGSAWRRLVGQNWSLHRLPATDGGQSDQATLQQQEQPWEYEDDRGIRVEEPEWDCPNCDCGAKMYRPASKDTCANCLYVVDGRHNEESLPNMPISARSARWMLAQLGEPWHGSPGSLETSLRRLRTHE
jgi:hypothetical protein